MNNEKAIKILRKGYPDINRYAASELETYEYDVETYNEAVGHAISHLEEDRWIPVSERLPNTLGVYNVTRKIIEGETSYVISDACYFDGQNTWHADTGVNHGRPYITDVIAWKPKPEPYESEVENGDSN